MTEPQNGNKPPAQVVGLKTLRMKSSVAQLGGTAAFTDDELAYLRSQPDMALEKRLEIGETLVRTAETLGDTADAEKFKRQQAAIRKILNDRAANR